MCKRFGTLLLAVFLVGLSCGSETDSTTTQSETERPDQLTAEQILGECHDFCYRVVGCVWEICNEDYPGSFSSSSATSSVHQCFDDYCETNRFEKLLQKDPFYIRCNAEMDCRSIALGVCDDDLKNFACRRSDPSSKPHLPPLPSTVDIGS